MFIKVSCCNVKHNELPSYARTFIPSKVREYFCQVKYIFKKSFITWFRDDYDKLTMYYGTYADDQKIIVDFWNQSLHGYCKFKCQLCFKPNDLKSFFIRDGFGVIPESLYPALIELKKTSKVASCDYFNSLGQSKTSLFSTVFSFFVSKV